MRVNLRLVAVTAAWVMVLLIVPSGPAGAHSVQCNTPSVTNYALIERLSNTSYRIAGSASCESTVDWIQIDCWPVHRHSFYWHSHTGANIGDTDFGDHRVAVGWSTVSGTDGDKYKPHCDAAAFHGTTVTWELESLPITL